MPASAMKTGTASITVVCLLVLTCGNGVAQHYGGSLWRTATEMAQFHIVVPPDASETLSQAATTFQKLWTLSTRRPITLSGINEGVTNVWLGSKGLPEDLVSADEMAALGPEAFLVRTYTPSTRDAARGARKHLIIAGGSDPAVLSGVYTFFSRKMGVFWLAPGLVFSPRPPSGLEEFSLYHRPEFSVREIELLRGDVPGVEEFRHAHILPRQRFVPPGLPEYFDGCEDCVPEEFASDDNIHYGSDAGVERLFQEISLLHSHGEDSGQHGSRDTVTWKVGESTVWILAGLSHLTPCLSAEGRLLNEREGSPAAAIIHTANGLAEKLQDAFPGEQHRVHVLLSPATRRPPNELRPHPEVIVQVSTADCNFAVPMTDRNCVQNVAFAENLDGWSRLGARIYIYDHLLNHADSRLPFPNLDVLRANILYYTQRAVDGVYFAAPAENEHGNLAPLRVWLAANLLFDPDLIYEEVLLAFLQGYYGIAARDVEAFLNLLQQELRASGKELKISDTECPWLSDDGLRNALAMLETARSRDTDEMICARVDAVASGLLQLQHLRNTSVQAPPE